MPVRITATGSPDPSALVITQDYLIQGQNNFREHYYLNDGSSDFQSDFMVDWQYLSDAVANYMGQNPEVDENDIAMRFTHCYDEAAVSLFLRMEICEMKPTTITDFDRPVHQILANSAESSLELMHNTVIPYNPGSLANEVYLNSFMYKPLSTEAITEPLSEDGGLKFVRTLVFPWKKEILAMYNQNWEALEPKPETMYIHFDSVSYTAYNPGDDAILWPHGLVMYLQADDHVLLDNENYVTMFRCKGCDLGTMCPPKCGSWIGFPLSTEAPQK